MAVDNVMFEQLEILCYCLQLTVDNYGHIVLCQKNVKCASSYVLPCIQQHLFPFCFPFSLIPVVFSVFTFLSTLLTPFSTFPKVTISYFVCIPYFCSFFVLLCTSPIFLLPPPFFLQLTFQCGQPHSQNSLTAVCAWQSGPWEYLFPCFCFHPTAFYFLLSFPSFLQHVYILLSFSCLLSFLKSTVVFSAFNILFCSLLYTLFHFASSLFPICLLGFFCLFPLFLSLLSHFPFCYSFSPFFSICFFYFRIFFFIVRSFVRLQSPLLFQLFIGGQPHS